MRSYAHVYFAATKRKIKSFYMKMQALLRTINLFIITGIVTVTAVDTIGQTTFKPSFRIVNDTTRQTLTPESFDVQILPDSNNHKFVLIISNPFGERLRINISGSEGSGFVDQTKDLQYSKRFDMGEAPDGSYVITVTGHKKSFSKTITLETVTTVNRGVRIQ